MAKLIASRLDYKACEKLLGKKETLKLGLNTYLERIGAVLSVRFHETRILRFFSWGSCLVNCQGWRSATTKKRLNQLMPRGQISQRDGTWYYVWGGGEAAYEDGMVITTDGPRNDELAVLHRRLCEGDWYILRALRGILSSFDENLLYERLYEGDGSVLLELKALFAEEKLLGKESLEEG